MSEHEIHPTDVELLERLGAIVGVIDPVPHDVLELSRALFTFRDPDAELMETVAADSPELSAVRGGGGGGGGATSRLHFFEFGELSIDVELTCKGAFCGVLGVVVAPGGAVGRGVTLETTAASFTCDVQPEGRFTFDAVPPGMVRLRLEQADGPKLTTRWFEAG